MEKVKGHRSLKWSLIGYIPFCMIAAFIGMFIIGHGTNVMQEIYTEKYGNFTDDIGYIITYDPELETADVIVRTGRPVPLSKATLLPYLGYWLICYAQYLLMPLWVVGCCAAAGLLFYRRELKEPISVLMEASRMIADNRLDFTVGYKKDNELGMLCSAFDEMRSELYKNNLEMWRSLEERKRINSAFSHELRTPLTVLKGYAELLEKYVPDGRISEEKLLSAIVMMKGQIARLEHFTVRMNDVCTAEDIVPQKQNVTLKEIIGMLSEKGESVCGEKFALAAPDENKTLFIDRELAERVCEELLKNAVRYAEKSVTVCCGISDSMLIISVADDGKGFSENILKNGLQPFSGAQKETEKLNFGAGLYICRIICERCGGDLTVENNEKGGKVTAKFLCK